jgi:D-aminopeptidase
MAARGSAGPDEGAGSIIVVVATDAPLLPTQCDRLAQRAALGIGRTGGAGENSSGDLVLAFATGNRDAGTDGDRLTVPLKAVRNEQVNSLFYAAIEATEEAILNALLQAETMTGRDGITAFGLDPERVRALLA